MKKIDKKIIRCEQQLVARCIKEDKEAWDEFVDTYRRLIYSTIIRTFHLVGYKNVEEAADDIFQDVFAQLLKNNCAKLKRFKWKRGCSLVFWLHIITKNLTLDYMRKVFFREKKIFVLKKETDDMERVLQDKRPQNLSFLKDIERKEAVGIFEKALQRLPKHDLYLVDLIYFRGFSHGRAAAMLGKSADAVYMQKKRIIEKLKKIVRGAI